MALHADRCWNAASFGRWLSPLAPEVRWLSPLLSPALRPGNAGAAAGAPPVGWYPANDPVRVRVRVRVRVSVSVRVMVRVRVTVKVWARIRVW